MSRRTRRRRRAKASRCSRCSNDSLCCASRQRQLEIRMIKIICTSCQKPLSLDETKLPMKEVTFPCPVCKTKLAVDRRQLETPAVPASSAEGAAPPAGEEDDSFGAKALIVGNDSPALRQAAKLIGFM